MMPSNNEFLEIARSAQFIGEKEEKLSTLYDEVRSCPWYTTRTTPREPCVDVIEHAAAKLVCQHEPSLQEDDREH